MNCPRCRALVLADDVNLENLVAKCRQCQEVFRFDVSELEAVTDRRRDSERPIKKRRMRAPQPVGMTLEDSGSNRRIVKRWFEYQHLFMVVFCVVWDSFLVFWYSLAIGINGPWIMILFPLMHVLVGVILTYATLANLLNRTVISVNDATLEVALGPIPWAGNVSVPVAAIDQVYCSLADLPQWATPRGHWMRPGLKVVAILRNGSQRLLLPRTSREEGLFIEQQLEEWLEINPAHVPGQVD